MSNPEWNNYNPYIVQCESRISQLELQLAAANERADKAEKQASDYRSAWKEFGDYDSETYKILHEFADEDAGHRDHTPTMAQKAMDIITACRAAGFVDGQGRVRKIHKDYSEPLPIMGCGLLWLCSSYVYYKNEDGSIVELCVEDCCPQWVAGEWTFAFADGDFALSDCFSSKEAAEQARAMKGQLFGVWNVTLGKFDFWDSDGPLLTEKKVAEWFVFVLNQRPLCHYEVRPYTAPREKPATQLIAENIVIKHNCQHVPGLAESIAESLESEKRGTAKCG